MRKSIAGNGADATAPATPGIVISNLRGEAIGDAVNAFRWSIATALVLEGLPLAKITVAAQYGCEVARAQQAAMPVVG
jgi:hypothetical protein